MEQSLPSDAVEAAPKDLGETFTEVSTCGPAFYGPIRETKGDHETSSCSGANQIYKHDLKVGSTGPIETSTQLIIPVVTRGINE